MRYIKVQNMETGEEAVIDTYESRYKRLGMGFLNMSRINRYFFKHITLTQRVESYRPNILNSFFTKLRQCYGRVLYIWTAEVQEGRAERYGERVLHWHVLVGFDWKLKFGKEDVLRLQSFWKYGNLDVKPVRSIGMRYLLKYIAKSLAIDVLYRVRRVGSSMIPALFRRSWKKLSDAISFFSKVGGSVDSMIRNFDWNWKGAFVRLGFRERLWVYVHSPSTWVCVDSFDLEGINSIF